MRTKLYATLITLTAILSFSLFAASSGPIKGDTLNGKQKYQQLCIACHGSTGLGDGVAAASLSNKPANLPKKINSVFKSTDKLAGKVMSGKLDEGMPAFKGVITKQDAIDIFAYINSIQ